jgi:ABC-type uncharacterized transport system auxiliary subunit
MRRRPAGTSILAAASLVALVAACAQPPLPEDHFYRLAVAAPTAGATTPKLRGTLEVERFFADGLTAGRPVVYSDSARPEELREYHYHFWVESPPVMLRDQFVAYLRGAGIASAVVTPEVRVEPDFVLTAKLKRLEQIVGTPARGAIEVDIAVRRTQDDRLLFQGSYGVEVEARTNAVGDAVAALTAALSRIYAKIVADLSRL